MEMKYPEGVSAVSLSDFDPWHHSYNLCPKKERFNVFVESERCEKRRKDKETGRL
jgi:hypothetical protein